MAVVSNYSDRLKEIMKDRNLRQVDILEMSKRYQKELGITMTKSHLSQYVNGKSNPDQRRIYLLSKTLNISEPWLMGYDVSMERISDEARNKDVINSIKLTSIYNSLEIARQERVYKYAEQQLNEQQNEKVVQDVFSGEDLDIAGKVAAGLGTRNFDKTQPLFTVRMNREDVPNDYDLALQVTGDSMEPTFKDGEIIFVKEQDEFQNGMIAAVEINEEAFIKKIYKEDNRICLVSLNRDTDENGNRLYPDFYADEKDELYLIGKVIL